MVSVRVNNGVPEAAPAPPAAPEAAAEPRAWTEGGALYCSGEVRILVLDDDQAVCRVMQAALAPNHFVVDIVSDPA